MPTPPLDLNAHGDHGTEHATAADWAAPPSGRYLPGAVLTGKYRLDALLGEGGMGAVWRATNLLLELPVAIKLIRADLDRGALRARLQLEARAAAKLGHPAIVRVFDVGESELGDPFIVMELLQGETLASVLTRGRLSAAYTVQLLLPIIDALGTAHARGIVHRDLKPDNLMIALEEQHVQPKILDFGIAKLIDPPPSDHKLTEAGAVVGSPDYMSPEQARGREDLDASTDIWSMCVVLYEAVTGSAPFTASNYHALLRAIVEDQPPSIVTRGAGDEALWNIILRGMAKDRQHRYSSMTELGQALATWLVSHGVHEDAAGASVESKWLGRANDASSAPSFAATAVSADFQPNAHQDSERSATGVARGPFTHTIAPHTRHRTRVLRAVGVVSAVCAAAAVLVLLLSKPWARQAGGSGRNHASLVSVINAARPAPLLASEPSVSPAPPVNGTPELVTPAVQSEAASDATRPRKARAQVTAASKSVPPPAHPLPPARSASMPSVSSSALPKPSATVTPAPNRARDRPLDLIAPY